MNVRDLLIALAVVVLVAAALLAMVRLAKDRPASTVACPPTC